MDDNCVRYYQDSDFETVQEWHLKHGTCLNDRSLLPSVGFIIEGLCAGFIYMTDSGVSFIEGYITNPDSSLKDRSRGLDIITECLISHAKIMGAKLIKCETRFNGIRRKAEKFGFRSLGKTTSMVKEIL